VDSSTNAALTIFRTSDVDISPKPHATVTPPPPPPASSSLPLPPLHTGADFYVTDLDATEWLQYSVTVSQAGMYRVSASVASLLSNSSFAFVVDGRTRTKRVLVPTASSLTDFQSVAMGSFAFPLGDHLFTIVSLTPGWSFYSLTIDMQQ